jgi:hypothetical protein
MYSTLRVRSGRHNLTRSVRSTKIAQTPSEFACVVCSRKTVATYPKG